MSYFLSKKSQRQVETLHPDLQLLNYRAIKVYDFSVTCGHRDETQQNALYREGKSQLKYPESTHNENPSWGFDAYPFPINWQILNMKLNDIFGNKKLVTEYYDEIAKFYFMAGVFKGIASEIGIVIRWGGDWNGNNNFADNKFDDLGHFELVTAMV